MYVEIVLKVNNLWIFFFLDLGMFMWYYISKKRRFWHIFHHLKHYTVTEIDIRILSSRFEDDDWWGTGDVETHLNIFCGKNCEECAKLWRYISYTQNISAETCKLSLILEIKYANFNNNYYLIYTTSEIDHIIHLNENYNRNFFSELYIIK